MILYRSLHLLKFFGIMLLAGGVVGSFVAGTAVDRKRAAHAIASPGLLLTWLAGYSLSLFLGVALSELWVLGGLSLSFGAHLALLRSVECERSTASVLSVVGPLLLVLVLMVFRPTWAGVLR